MWRWSAAPAAILCSSTGSAAAASGTVAVAKGQQLAGATGSRSSVTGYTM